jgi:hypothetical protein
MNGSMAKIWVPVFAQIDIKNTELKLQDGTTPTPNEIIIKVGEGNLTYSENRTIEYTLDRGRIDEVREGDEVPMDVSFDLLWEFITGNTDSAGVPPTVEDVLKNQNNASTWISSDPDTCRPFAVDVLVENVPVCGAGSPTQEQEFITLPDFRYETLDHDVRAGTISVTGRCNAKVASIVRSLQPST